MNGIELTNYIRNKNSEVKIVGVTGSGEKEEHMEFLNGIYIILYIILAGASDVVIKPLDLNKCRIILS